MNINHRPIFNTQNICEIYSEKDGVPVTYVCTTALDDGTQAMDVYYRETPHPEFGNRYFGLYWSDALERNLAHVMICNADKVEELFFEMVEANGQWQYSQHRHDFYSVGNVTIDGGRAYMKLMGNIHAPRSTMKVLNGEFCICTSI